MGSFTNKQYTNVVDSLVQANASKLNNPYYVFSDKKPTKVVYYKQNLKKSTLDEASQLQYAHVSSESALRYNKIEDFYLYGIDRMSVDYDVGDNGLEANAISGEAYILPNTIEPIAGDFFSITYVKEDLLFKVNSVTPDTLDTGANIYKIEYQLELTNSSENIERQVVDSFKFIVNNIGTEFNSVIKSSDYELTAKLEGLIDNLIDWYIGIFFKPKLQTFVYKYDEAWNFYDPFMIEFMRRHDLMSTSDYFYVAHQTNLEATFPFEYAKSIFAAIEEKAVKKIANTITCTADMITDINSLFTSRIEEYYQVKYVDNMPFKTRFSIIDYEIADHIKFNKLYDDGDKKSIYNLLISYMNDDENYISDAIIEKIHMMEFDDNKTIFYLIPIYIFIIKNYIATAIMGKS